MKRRRKLLLHDANIEDERTGDASELYHFLKMDGCTGVLEVPRTEIVNPKAIRRMLIGKNMTMESSDYHVRCVIAEPPRRLYIRAARTGWRPDTTAFVTPTKVIDTCDRHRPRSLLPPNFKNGAQHHVAQVGELAEWKRGVADPCCQHSGLAILALSAGFGSCILKLVGEHSFGLNFYGPSKAGKSMCLMAASSIGGAGRESDLSNWGDTSAALTELAPILDDILLPMNEVSLIGGPKGGYHSVIASTVFALSEGREKRRHSASVFDSKDGATTFTRIFVSTAEHPFAYYARLAGQERDDGEVARCTDVAAVRPGFDTVIDRFPRSMEAAAKPAYAARIMRQIRRACEKNHGVALEPFVRHIMRDTDECRRSINSRRKEFMKGLSGEDLSQIWRHQARHFSLIYAGGAIAIDAGLLRLTHERLLAVIREHFTIAMSVPTEEAGNSLPDAKNILRDKLRGGGILPAAQGSSCPDGFFINSRDGRRYVVHAATFRQWFNGNASRVDAVLHWLHSKDFLVTSRAASGGSILKDRAQRWPDGKSKRAFVFDDPFRRISESGKRTK